MEMKGDHVIPAPRQRVWDALNDADILKAALPGCESLEKEGDSNFIATVMAKVGPVKTRFNGSVALTELNPPHSYRISGEGKGGAAGFAKGSAQVFLDEITASETRIRYEVDATIGGKLAQVGQRLIDTVAMKMAEDFFSTFVQLVAPPDISPENADAREADGTLGTSGSPTRKAGAGIPKPLMIGGLVALILIAVFVLVFYN